MTERSSPGIELLPCPFCNGEPQLVTAGPGNWYVRCLACKCSTNDVMSDHVVSLWNARGIDEAVPTARPVAFRVPRVVNDEISKTEFRLFADEDEARRAACDIGGDYDGLYLVADRRAAFFAQPRPTNVAQHDREELQATYNDLLALQGQTDQVPLTAALDAIGDALRSLDAAQQAPGAK